MCVRGVGGEALERAQNMTPECLNENTLHVGLARKSDGAIMRSKKRRESISAHSTVGMS